MTDGELSRVLEDFPTLYHMAECGSWPSIQRHGLLSTSALLDLYEVEGTQRQALEATRRLEGVMLQRNGLEGAMLRDQKPMDDDGLARCLDGGLTPTDWYRLLNGKVFFWLTRSRLQRLLDARPYRGRAHEVLELDASAVVSAYRDAITFSAINSGATRPFPARRGPETFLPIAAYPYDAWRAKRPPGERIVEFAVGHAMPDAARFVRRVTRMGGADTGMVLFEASPAETRIAPASSLV